MMHVLSSPIFLVVVLFMVAKMLSMTSMIEGETSSPFECGFDPLSNSRLPFSMQFFLLAVMFLIFDIEIALVMLVPLCVPLSHPSLLTTSLSAFFLMLLMGLLHEWNEGALDWKPYKAQ